MTRATNDILARPAPFAVSSSPRAPCQHYCPTEPRPPPLYPALHAPHNHPLNPAIPQPQPQQHSLQLPQPHALPQNIHLQQGPPQQPPPPRLLQPPPQSLPQLQPQPQRPALPQSQPLDHGAQLPPPHQLQRIPSSRLHAPVNQQHQPPPQHVRSCSYRPSALYAQHQFNAYPGGGGQDGRLHHFQQQQQQQQQQQHQHQQQHQQQQQLQHQHQHPHHQQHQQQQQQHHQQPQHQQLQRYEQNLSRTSYIPSNPEPVFICNMTRDTFIRTCSTFLDQCASSNINRVPIPMRGQSAGVFFSVTAPAIATESYVRRLVTFANCSPAAFVVMLVLLDRIGSRCKELLVTPRSLHRLLTTALTLGCKLMDDKCYPNAHYAKVGGVPSTSEMNRLELAFLFQVNFRLHVSFEEFTRKQMQLENVRIPNPKSPRSVLDQSITATPKPTNNSPNTYATPMNQLRPPIVRQPAPSASTASYIDVKFSHSTNSYSIDNSKSCIDSKHSQHLALRPEQLINQPETKLEQLSNPISKLCANGPSVYNDNVAPISKGFPSLSSLSTDTPLQIPKNYIGSESVVGNGAPPICKRFENGTNQMLPNTKSYSRSVSSGLTQVRSERISHTGNGRDWQSGKWGASPIDAAKFNLNMKQDVFVTPAPHRKISDPLQKLNH